ncbi:centromere protein F isoform X7 [Gossypium australe]|uniref:Centromere protein F isoform X7 n=1 Tax=Gossypium australe TaxID=47621 RepID=A0A5B6U5H5_9ROSI|nr:centromere protein F isoform X7 [Gossypium australe]
MNKGQLNQELEMEMELLRLSKFSLQLRALVTESRDLRERNRSATEQIHLLIQKQKQTEEEYSRKLQELQAEVASCNESQQKLERKVSYLQNDNALLENKQKELQGIIRSLLQSRDSFINAYQESTHEMKQSIEARDRKIAVLSETLNSHLSLFDSIEKEAFSVKQVVDNVERIVSEKEEVGMREMDQVSAFEKAFVERINDLENRLKNDGYEFQRKNKIISELEAQLEAAKISDCSRAQIEEISTQVLITNATLFCFRRTNCKFNKRNFSSLCFLSQQHLQKTISAKDTVIQNLVSEKEALHFEVRSLANILQKIQNAVAHMNEEDRSAVSSKLESQEECQMNTSEEDNRIQDTTKHSAEQSPNKTCRMDPAENRAKSVVIVAPSVKVKKLVVSNIVRGFMRPKKDSKSKKNKETTTTEFEKGLREFGDERGRNCQAVLRQNHGYGKQHKASGEQFSEARIMEKVISTLPESKGEPTEWRSTKKVLFKPRLSFSCTSAYKGKKTWKNRPKPDAARRGDQLCRYCKKPVSCSPGQLKASKGWLLDSSCTNHMSLDATIFKTLDRSYKTKVKIGNGQFSKAEGKGDVLICTSTGNKLISNVLLVPEIDRNLLSIAQLLEKGYSVEFKGKECQITDPNGSRLMSVTMTDKIEKDDACEVCQLGKQARQPFPSNMAWRASKKLQLVHTDVCGPMKTQSLSGNSLDNGTENTSAQFQVFCNEAGIKHQLTNIYTPQQNGVSERNNRSLMDMARCLMFEKILPKTSWAKAVNTAVYLQNRLPTKALARKTPFEAWFGFKPSLAHLRTFGCICYAQVSAVKRSKLEKRAQAGILFSTFSSAAKHGASQQLSQGYNSTSHHLQANDTFNSCSACSPVCSDPQPPANVLSISVNGRMDTCGISVHQLDSECSTTQAETSNIQVKF